MSLEITKKEKILALLIVVLLFIFMGVFSFSVSIINKNRTETLKKTVIRLKTERINRENLTKIVLASSTPSSITSRSYLTMAVTEQGDKKILAEKNTNLVLPIASITKLMLAIITMENIDLNTKVIATLDYIGKEESAFVLETNRIYTVKDLLANALISSDNDSARLISSVLGENTFIEKMNLKAKELGLNETKFINVTGLDPKNIGAGLNVSTVTDLAKLIIYIKNRYPEILKTTTKPIYNICDINNNCKTVVSTNKLLLNNASSTDLEIIGGKTGSTDLALKNLILITKPISGMYLINIVLGSENNFADTLSLINNIIIKN